MIVFADLLQDALLETGSHSFAFLNCRSVESHFCLITNRRSNTVQLNLGFDLVDFT